MKQHSWPQAEPGFPRTLDCWALRGPLVLLGDFQAPSEKDTIKKELDWGCDLCTWHANPLIRKVCLSMRCCEFFGRYVCTRQNSLQDLENMRLPKHKSYSLSGMIRDCGGLVSLTQEVGSLTAEGAPIMYTQEIPLHSVI